MTGHQLRETLRGALIIGIGILLVVFAHAADG